MIKKTVTLLLIAHAAVPGAHAQVKCTMPNGVVITQQLGGCPAGATKAQAADGTLLALPPPPPKPARATKATPSPWPTPAKTPLVAATQPPAPPPPNAYDYARLICKAFEQVGASTCDVNSNVFSESTIETTLAIAPASALITCKDVAASMRAKTDAFESKNWKILIFSPFSGNRPIASCRL